jgi:hypothetical protein
MDGRVVAGGKEAQVPASSQVDLEGEAHLAGRRRQPTHGRLHAGREEAHVRDPGDERRVPADTRLQDHLARDPSRVRQAEGERRVLPLDLVGVGA